MIGLKRLDNLQVCVDAGARRRRARRPDRDRRLARRRLRSSCARSCKAYGDTTRTVWVGRLVRRACRRRTPRATRPTRATCYYTPTTLAVSRRRGARRNFERYGLLDDQVRFLVGWFKDTLPTAPIERLAVMRLDGDMYESTMRRARRLYPKLSAGGFLIVDDYLAIDRAVGAVDDSAPRTASATRSSRSTGRASTGVGASRPTSNAHVV